MFPLLGSYKLTAGIVIVSINTGAYMAEIVRAGIQSLDKGQNEAARSIGMNNFQTMIYIILPQAIKNAFPAIGNEFVVNIKDTSVLNVVGITELFFQSMTVAGTTYAFRETFFISAHHLLVLNLHNHVDFKSRCRKKNEYAGIRGTFQFIHAHHGNALQRGKDLTC